MQQPPSYEMPPPSYDEVPPPYEVMRYIPMHLRDPHARPIRQLRPDQVQTMVSHDVFMMNPRRAALWPRLQRSPTIHTVLVPYNGNYLMYCPHCDSPKVLP